MAFIQPRTALGAASVLTGYVAAGAIAGLHWPTYESAAIVALVAMPIVSLATWTAGRTIGWSIQRRRTDGWRDVESVATRELGLRRTDEGLTGNVLGHEVRLRPAGVNVVIEIRGGPMNLRVGSSAPGVRPIPFGEPLDAALPVSGDELVARSRFDFARRRKWEAWHAAARDVQVEDGVLEATLAVPLVDAGANVVALVRALAEELTSIRDGDGSTAEAALVAIARHDPSASARWAALDLLRRRAREGDRAAADSLSAALADPDPVFRLAVVGALPDGDPRREPVLVSLLDHAATRLEAVQRLGDSGGAGAIAALRALGGAAADGAVRQIQQRIPNAESGQLSVSADAGGELSEPAAAGAVSVAKKQPT